MKKKARWTESSMGRMVLVDSEGQVMAKISKTMDGTFVYNDKEFIDAYSAQRFVESEKYTEVLP